MNKKVVGGLLAVLFVTQIAQTGAILKMQKVASAPVQQTVAMAPVANYQYDFKQQAALGTATVISDPTPQGLVIIISYRENNRCTVTWIDGEHTSSASGTTIYTASGVAHGCNIGLTPDGGDVGTVSFINKEGGLAVTGSTSVLDAQFKLKTLGYFSGVITGKMDAATQLALRAFQTANKIAATGAYGPQTKVALDSKISGVIGVPVAGTSFTFTK